MAEYFLMKKYCFLITTILCNSNLFANPTSMWWIEETGGQGWWSFFFAIPPIVFLFWIVVVITEPSDERQKNLEKRKQDSSIESILQKELLSLKSSNKMLEKRNDKRLHENEKLLLEKDIYKNKMRILQIKMTLDDLKNSRYTKI
tara:strand:- start:437 stop:871 length:435 start_codon:yes stop_codon:yes gene_type:complete